MHDVMFIIDMTYRGSYRPNMNPVRMLIHNMFY